MRLTADDYKETNESPTLLKDAALHPEEDNEEKSQSAFSKGLQNFWYYHKVKVFLGLLIIIVGIFVIPDVIDKSKPSALTICAVNCSVLPDTTSLTDDLVPLVCQPGSKEKVRFITDMSFALGQEEDFDKNILLALQVNIDSADYDALLLDTATANYLLGFLNTLPEEIPSYVPARISDAFTVYETTPEGYHTISPGFLVTNSQPLKDARLFDESIEYVLIPLPNAPHPDNLVIFLQYLLDSAHH